MSNQHNSILHALYPGVTDCIKGLLIYIILSIFNQVKLHRHEYESAPWLVSFCYFIRSQTFLPLHSIYYYFSICFQINKNFHFQKVYRRHLVTSLLFPLSSSRPIKVWNNWSKFQWSQFRNKKKPLTLPVGLLWSLQNLGLKYELDCIQSWW